jgi:putative membrane protein
MTPSTPWPTSAVASGLPLQQRRWAVPPSPARRLVPLSRLLLQPLPELGSIQQHARLFDGQRRIPHGSPMSRERFPAWVYATGDEPDPRFTLANERTYLAWIRTALALTAGGVALEALGLPPQPVLRLTASGILVILGAIVPLLAWSTWGTIERAMRNGTPLPGSRVSLPVGVGVSVVAFLIGLSLLLR